MTRFTYKCITCRFSHPQLKEDTTHSIYFQPCCEHVETSYYNSRYASEWVKTIFWLDRERELPRPQLNMVGNISASSKLNRFLAELFLFNWLKTRFFARKWKKIIRNLKTMDEINPKEYPKDITNLVVSFLI